MFRAIDGFKAETFEQLFDAADAKDVMSTRISGPFQKSRLGGRDYRRLGGPLKVGYHQPGEDPSAVFTLEGPNYVMPKWTTWFGTQSSSAMPSRIVYYRTRDWKPVPTINQLCERELTRLKWYLENGRRLRDGLPPLEKTPKGPRVPRWYAKAIERQKENLKKFTKWKLGLLRRLRKRLSRLESRQGKDEQKRSLKARIAAVEAKEFIFRSFAPRPYKWRWVNLLTGEHVAARTEEKVDQLNPLPVRHVKVLQNDKASWDFSYSFWETSEAWGESFSWEMRSTVQALKFDDYDVYPPLELETKPWQQLWTFPSLFEELGIEQIADAVNRHRKTAKTKVSLPLWIVEIADYWTTATGLWQMTVSAVQFLRRFSGHLRDALRFVRYLFRTYDRIDALSMSSSRINRELTRFAREQGFTGADAERFVANVAQVVQHELDGRLLHQADTVIDRFVSDFEFCVLYLSNADLWFKFGWLNCVRDTKELVQNATGEWTKRAWYKSCQKALKERGKLHSFHTRLPSTVSHVSRKLRLEDIVNLPDQVVVTRTDSSGETFSETVTPEHAFQAIQEDIRLSYPDGRIPPCIRWEETRSTDIVVTTLMSYDWVDSLGWPLDETIIERMWQLDTIGLNFDPIWIWDHVPYSFVIDWFSNLGSWLEAKTKSHKWTRADLRISNVVLTRKERQRVTLSVVPHWHDGYEGDRSAQLDTFKTGVQYSIEIDEHTREITGERGIRLHGGDVTFEIERYQRDVLTPAQVAEVQDYINGHKLPTEPFVLKPPKWFSVLTGGELLAQTFLRG